MVFNWPVVPICYRQKKDINSKNLLSNGHFRQCDVYKSGGGYDLFPSQYEKFFGRQINPLQFVVQLYGCPLDCWYCYVTKEGIFGKPVFYSTEELLKAYMISKCSVFHLMGGAPALYLEHWKDIAFEVEIFHSDFLLIEKKYELQHLEGLPGVHAVSLKKEVPFSELALNNLRIIEESKIKYYFTITGEAQEWENYITKYYRHIDVLKIPIRRYKALLY